MRRVLLPVDDARRRATVTSTIVKESHRRIHEAANFIREYVSRMLAQRSPIAHVDVLIAWKSFITSDAQVIQLIVPDHLNAFMMFETLNDRGLKASEADLLKNYLFQLAADRIDEAHQRWAKTVGVLEALGRDDVLMDYLRHMTICQFGPTTAKEVYQKMKLSIASKARAVEFLDELASGASEYSALFNPSHTIWNQYAPSTRGHLRTLLELRVEQIRALAFSVLRNFEVAEVEKAMKLFVSWSVRFLIAGGGRGGVLDTAYGRLAASVAKREINDARTLMEMMRDTVPNDATFETAFAEARVSQVHLARYYLRLLERQKRALADPEWVPNDDETINLEHILPQTPGSFWPMVPADLAAAYYKRLGNMVLLQARKNGKIGNADYETKRPTLAASEFYLTASAGAYAEWGIAEITERQQKLAKIAVQTWPLDVSKPIKGAGARKGS
jgi:hypothetical protein